MIPDSEFEENIAPTVSQIVSDKSMFPPNEIAVPLIVILELANLLFAIEPANIAFVIPLALTRNASLLISILLSSTFTLISADEAVNPFPANKDATSSMDSFLVGSPLSPSSENAIKSPLAMGATVRSFIFNFNVTAADSEPLFATVIPPFPGLAIVAT